MAEGAPDSSLEHPGGGRLGEVPWKELGSQLCLQLSPRTHIGVTSSGTLQQSFGWGGTRTRVGSNVGPRGSSPGGFTTLHAGHSSLTGTSSPSEVHFQALASRGSPSKAPEPAFWSGWNLVAVLGATSF